MSQLLRIIIIGAGPAGLMAAICAARQPDTSVTVLEQLPRPGMKLLATGGGKCNITNILPPHEFIAAFGRQGRFMLPALEKFSSEDLRNFLHEHHVETEVTDGFHIFPKSQRATDILQVLLDECYNLKVSIKNNSVAESLVIKDNHISGVKIAGQTIPADRVIIACGGKGYPSLGGNDLGYELASQAGHEIIPPIPAMVGIKLRETWTGQCPGISLTDCTVFIDLPKYRNKILRGELLFTHRGISGPPVINISADISTLRTKQPEIPLRVNLFADKNRNFWMQEFSRWQQQQGRKHIHKLLAASMPQSLAVILCRVAPIAPVTIAASFPAPQRENLAELLSATPLHSTGTEGWERAMVTRGGVALKNISPDTLESRLVSGLYFAGEVMDLDGPCGGFNLQWAFSSGFLAGCLVE